MKILFCTFNMDAACVELKFADGSMIAIDTIAVENEVVDNIYQRSELDSGSLYNRSFNILFIASRAGVSIIMRTESRKMP